MIADVQTEIWKTWLGRLYSLRREKRGSHERPHKPVLLLSIIHLQDGGLITKNEIPISDELIETFRAYFKVVRLENDRPTFQNPFYFLSGDSFWHLEPKAGQQPIYETGFAGRSPSVAQLKRKVSHARFDQELWELLANPISRHQLREAIIARYFPERREELAKLVVGTKKEPAEQQLHDKMPPGRDAAFRHTILEVYDFRCAACGIRVLLDQQLSLVEAAHLIPFGISRNDKPTNGMALCPNHHWAMDRFLIAPCPDPKRRAGVWRVNEERLDDRIEGQRDLVALGGKPVISPGEEKYFPAAESLRWRAEHLAVSY